MQRRAALALVSLLGAYTVACASSGTSGTASGSPPPLGSGSPDASGAFVFADDAGSDAGPLLSPCDPTGATSCPTGFLCYPTHTSTTWWVDLYGKCTFDCTASTLALCSSMDGICGCPVSATGVTQACSADSVDNDGGAAGGASEDGGAGTATLAPLVCVPAVKPGTTPGSTDGPGGCGGPSCGGGPEAGALPIEDAGSSEQ
jgi:hypothetical protein